MPRVELYPFPFLDPLIENWVRARCVAERHAIAARYAEFAIIAPPPLTPLSRR